MLDKRVVVEEEEIFLKGLSSKNDKLKPWRLEPSTTARNCRNFIREVVDNLDLQPNPEKPVVALSLGDPTIFGNLRPPEEAIKAVTTILQEGSCNGYAPSTGHEAARKAVAEYLSFDGVEYEPKDLILCSGCSSSLEICITALADGNKGQNILLPRPGFAIYRTLAQCIGINVKFYNLLPENKWEVDLEQMKSQIDNNTAAIVINNPSNPCGSNYTPEHLEDILKIAYVHRIPVIADEIYERLVFPGKKFVSMAALHSGVPLLICGGLGKRFLVPGWRMGWIAVHDETNVLEHVRKSLISLSQRIIGSNTLIQGALPQILANTPQSFHDDLAETLALHAKIAFDRLSNIKGLTPYMPEAAMYMIVEINLRNFPEYETGLDFVKKLMEEESVFCLPGECFEIPGFVRIVLTVPQDILEEACDRIAEFCNRHFIE
ncbi:hypothetical protein GWI33_022439 [Rhynchophorus ferrugineus]|uniref:Tyrosine aminotransferase n=1 Tax=Rhynchophorus ferrugineus TaxID=354439 RepID=A0A834MHU7_RHYFE|nr:hypothetical protein GWI33_022439 [Rhynchophorus ferrugineus]